MTDTTPLTKPLNEIAYLGIFKVIEDHRDNPHFTEGGMISLDKQNELHNETSAAAVIMNGLLKYDDERSRYESTGLEKNDISKLSSDSETTAHYLKNMDDDTSLEAFANRMNNALKHGSWSDRMSKKSFSVAAQEAVNVAAAVMEVEKSDIPKIGGAAQLIG